MNCSKKPQNEPLGKLLQYYNYKYDLADRATIVVNTSLLFEMLFPVSRIANGVQKNGQSRDPFG
jgi:hypothetical protein